MAKILKYVLGLDGANRFESFYSVGVPAKDFVPYSAVDNRDDHVTDEEFDVEVFRKRWHRDPSPAEKGCMLSHYNMWKDFLASDADWALLAEDDVLISPDLQPVVERIIRKSILTCRWLTWAISTLLKLASSTRRLIIPVFRCFLLLCTASTVWVVPMVQSLCMVPPCIFFRVLGLNDS